MPAQKTQNLENERFPGNVRSLIWKGFLTQRIKVADIALTLKTLNGFEFLQVDESSASPWRKNLLRVWYSIASVEDTNVLVYRNDADVASEIMKTLFNFDRTFLMLLSSKLNALAEWYSYEMKNVYRYCLTEESMLRWPQCRGKILSDPMLTLTPGTELIGPSHHQLAWIKMQEDAEEQEQSRMIFENSLFVAQSFVGKEINKIRNQLRQHDDERARMNSQILQGLSADRMNDINKLIDELERQVSGDKDEAEKEIERQELNAYRKQLWDSTYSVMLAQVRYKMSPVDGYIHAVGEQELTDEDIADLYQQKAKKINENSLGAKINLTRDQVFQIVSLMRHKAIQEVQEKLQENPEEIKRLTQPPTFSPKPSGGRPDHQLIPPSLREAQRLQEEEARKYEEAERARTKQARNRQ